MGSPLIINDLDCDVELPRTKDFDSDESNTARFVRLQAELNRTCEPSPWRTHLFILADSQVASLLYYRHCSPTRLRLVKDPNVCIAACSDILEHLLLWRTSAEGWQCWSQIHRYSLLLKVCHE